MRTAHWLQLAALIVVVGGTIELKRELHAIDRRIVDLETIVDAPMREPTPAQWAKMSAESAAWSAAKDRETEAITKCRTMGQVAAIGPGTEAGPRIVCLQAPSVAFDLDPEWPR